MRCISIAAVGLLLFNQSGYSWGSDGHELVARIAAKHLTPRTRKAVADLLRLDTLVHLPPNPQDQDIEDAMAIVASWPDHINKHATGTSEWHYIDIGLLEGQEAIAKRCALRGSCVVDKISQIRVNLKSGAKLGVFEPFEELKFLIHFAGDIHQPLHSSTNQDAGGNCVLTHGLGESELHAVWDSGLVNQIRKAPVTRAPGVSPSPHSLISNTDVAISLNQKITPADVTTWSKNVDPSAIAMESHQVAVDKVYGPLMPPMVKTPGFVAGISPISCIGVPPVLKTTKWEVAGVYGEATLTVVRSQLSKAGIRLAQMLNDTFDSPAPH
jgi:hypothetical protein